MRRRRKVAIDTHDVGELRGVVRRTRLIRLVLAAAAVAALLATVASARSLDVQRHTIVPSGSTGVIVVDVSLSIANSYGDVRRTLQNVVGGDAPVGLVVFSDVPYELFPPGTPASELRAGPPGAHPARARGAADAVDAELSRRDAHLGSARARRPDASPRRTSRRARSSSSATSRPRPTTSPT